MASSTLSCIVAAGFVVVAASAPAAGCSPAVDLDGDLVVDVDDLLAVFAEWGQTLSPADLDGDGTVEVDDMIIVLTCWGTVIPETPVVTLATNLGENLPYGAAAFNDVFKQSWEEWFSTDAVFGGPFNTGYGQIMTDESGWPSVDIPWDPDGDGPIPPQVLHTLMLRDLYWGAGGPFPPSDTQFAQRFPAGDYLVTFDGTGTIEMFGAGTGTQTYSGPGPHMFPAVDPGNFGLGIKIISSSAADPIRNIQIRMPGYSLDDAENPYGPFTTAFVETLREFGVVRFMGWGKANNHPCYNGIPNPRWPSCEHTWAGRATPSDHTQSTGRGASIEYMIELANQAEIDPWFVIPHAATDEYVTEMALMVAADLDAERKVYVEYSNEVWNGLYDAFHYANARGEGLGDFPYLAWQTRRSQEIFCIFKEVGGFDDDRLVTMLGSQFAVPAKGETLLQYWNDPEITPNPCGVELDTIGVGAYFADDDEHDAVEGDTVDDVVAKVMKSIHEGRYYQRSLDYQALADEYGVEVIAYEGGHHLVEPNSNSQVQYVFAQLTRGPRIKELYFAAYDVWATNTNGAIYTYASTIERYSNTSFFGHKEYAAQELYEFDADGLRPYKMEAVHEIALGMVP